MISNKKVAIVIVTYNSRHYLSDCLSSLEAQNYAKNLVRIILIDNNSTDSTLEFVREKYPHFKIIHNRKNIGFASANNQGYFLAQKWGADYLALLNPDTIVEKNWLKNLVETLNNDKKIGAVQAKLLLYPEKNLINSLGNVSNFLSVSYCGHYREKDNHGLTRPMEIGYASGGAVLLNMVALKHTDLFDEKLFMYHEDVDLSWHLRLAGYKIMVDPRSVVWHKYNFSKAKYKFYFMERNRLIVMLQNYKLATLIVFLPAIVFWEIAMLVYFILNGWGVEKIKGWWWIIINFISIIKTKSKNKKIRKIKDRQILKYFTGPISSEIVDSPILNYFVNPFLAVYFWLAKKVIFW
ncbi:MAG: glycosyltransferase family 2 protein [bacterium]